MAAFAVLTAIGLFCAFLWLQNQLYSDSPLAISPPDITQPPDIQSRLLQAGQIRLSGPEIAQLIWLDKPPEMEALSIEVGEFEAETLMHVQSSLRIGEDSDLPYLNIDVQLGFEFEQNAFKNTEIHRCILGTLDLTRWCKGTELDSELTTRLQEQTSTDPILQSTMSLIQRAHLEDKFLVIELRQQDLLRQVLDQLQNLDPSLLNELQNLDLNLNLE